MGNRVKVFIIDDSPMIRQILTSIIVSCSELELVGEAENGRVALEKLKTVTPDIITLDIQMPEMDGLETLERIMVVKPTPVIMISSFTKDGADITFRALELGAVDYIQKPELSSMRKNINLISDLLITKIKIFSNFELPGKKRFKEKSFDDEIPVIGGLPSFNIPKVLPSDISYICIGASTGGTVALTQIIPKLKEGLKVPVLVVQHMPKHYTKSFANRLNLISKLTVIEAQGGEVITPGYVYIAQGGRHMKVRSGRIVLDDTEEVNCHKPSVDVLFYSMGAEFGSKNMAIILTGMGSDGARGIEFIKNAGGYTVAQDEESSVIFGMPSAAIKTGKVDRIIPLDEVSGFINNFFK